MTNGQKVKFFDKLYPLVADWFGDMISDSDAVTREYAPKVADIMVVCREIKALDKPREGWICLKCDKFFRLGPNHLCDREIGDVMEVHAVEDCEENRRSDG